MVSVLKNLPHVQKVVFLARGPSLKVVEQRGGREMEGR